MEDENVKPPSRTVRVSKRVWHVVSHLLDDVDHEKYSSTAPRRADGSRTKPFNFNGNGFGR